MDGNPPVVAREVSLGFRSRRKERGGVGSHRPGITFPKLSGANRFPVNSTRSPDRGKANKPEGSLAFPYLLLTRMRSVLNRL